MTAVYVAMLSFGTTAMVAASSSGASGGSGGASSSSSVRGGASCTTPSDCGLLGNCVSGHCECDAGFTGPMCTFPDLSPAKPPAENALFSRTAHSWGGKPIRNPDGRTWSLFAAEMTLHCPLHMFNNNSAIRRAVSHTGAGGPFTGGEIVYPPFAHNPTVTTAPDGTILLFYIGAPEHRQVNCTLPGRLASTAPSLRWKPQTDVINMAWSKSPTGPWQTRTIIGPARPSDNQTAWNCHCSNPSPVILPSGRILLMYRGTPCDLAGASCNSAWECVRQGIAEAPSYHGNFVKRRHPLSLASTSEDAFFWRSPRGFHLLTHSWRTCGEPLPGSPDKPNSAAGSCGAYSWSEDSKNWTTAPTAFYGAGVRWENGSTTHLSARQRPQIVFDAAGRPEFLFNGVTSVEYGAERSWTMAVPFNS